MRKNEMRGEFFARRVGETHNNKRRAFSAHGFTCTGMTFLEVRFTNVGPMAATALDLSNNNIYWI